MANKNSSGKEKVPKVYATFGGELLVSHEKYDKRVWNTVVVNGNRYFPEVSKEKPEVSKANNKSRASWRDIWEEDIYEGKGKKK